MDKKNEIIHLLNFPIDEIYKSFTDIPFGNSDYQIEKFIINANITPHRAFRSVCLTMNTKIGALKEAYYNKKILEIDLEELLEKIENPETNKFDKARSLINYDKKIDQQKDSDKLINDAIHELQFLYKWWKILPHPTREEFENKEKIYYKESLNRQIKGVVGASESLLNMGLKLSEKGELIESETLFDLLIKENNKMLE